MDGRGERIPFGLLRPSVRVHIFFWPKPTYQRNGAGETQWALPSEVPSWRILLLGSFVNSLAMVWCHISVRSLGASSALDPWSLKMGDTCKTERIALTSLSHNSLSRKIKLKPLYHLRAPWDQTPAICDRNALQFDLTGFFQRNLTRTKKSMVKKNLPCHSFFVRLYK
jgi:hypothetical protein